MKRYVALTVCLVCLSSAAWSQATPDALPDGTNYPEPQCRKPQTDLLKPTTVIDNYQATDAYNAKVKAFNRDAAAYSACMHAYIDKANDDARRIQDKANADMKQIADRANASVKAIQDKIEKAAADANSVTTALNQDTAKLRK